MVTGSSSPNGTRRAGPARRSFFFGRLLIGVLGVAHLLSGCGDLAREGHASDPSAARAPEALVFVFDRSSSVQDHELLHARDLTRNRLETLEHADRVVAIELLELGLDEEPRRWSQRVPDRQFRDRLAPRDSVVRARFLQDVRDYLVRYADPEGREDMAGTDILSTLHLVAAELQAYPEYRMTLVLYSDMLQANGVLNMEGPDRDPEPAWVDRQGAAGTLPDLTGLCVVVVGARTDTARARAVQRFWTRYFEVTGAVLAEHNYTYRPVRLPANPCPGR